jgi:alanyl-tRNA synthetase
MKSQDIRHKFLQFFKEKQHRIVPSAPMVIKDDPTLMFTNAGMNQFKAYFLGNAKTADQRVADTQKCLRVSGKHNDLEEVGKDTYHHTMFEMLGNWSFGQSQPGGNGYFKKEAIEWAWELLTEVYGIDPSWMYVTVFEGSNDADQLEKDEEALALWRNLVPESQILYGNKKDNFWEMGDQGPCGPCSEIHVDIRSAAEKAKIPGASLVNNDHPQVIEIWNLVFMQFNRKADGQLERLPAQHVDTGMGFERLCMVLQGVQSNYDTDVFKPLIREIENITDVTFGQKEETDIAIRVIADHIRAVSFSIADGQLPSNAGAGYVIRRILRRAIRYGFTFLGAKEPTIFRLVKILVDQMGSSFPELKEQQQLITNVVREEEQSFLKTLDQGLQLLDVLVAGLSTKVLPGDKAFELYDTFGFPIDLTALILSEKGFGLDQEGFAKSMEAQKARSRKAAQIDKEDWVVLREDDQQEFVGYDTLEVDVRLVKYRKMTSQKEGVLYQLVFNLTPFYPEGGGQVGDKGYLEAPNGNITYIIDTKRENQEIVHFAKQLPGELDGKFKAVVDRLQRARTSQNHSATHLMHQALRSVLGTHVTQKGSAVHSKYLRFDFSHFAKLSQEELEAVEQFVNARIESQIPLVEQRMVPMEQAVEQGAMALFGEKYGDAVRTIRFGSSIELCGGTHVANTSDIWHFKIISETAVAAGIRRIEAITGDAVRAYFMDHYKQLTSVKEVLNATGDPLAQVKQLQEQNQLLKKELESIMKEKAMGLKQGLIDSIQEVNGIKLIAQKVDLAPGLVKDLCFQIGAQMDNLVLVLGTAQEDKAMISCYVSKELVADRGLHAGEAVKQLGQYIDGSGGGQPFFATAGGKNPEGLAQAVSAATDWLNAAR